MNAAGCLDVQAAAASTVLHAVQAECAEEESVLTAVCCCYCVHPGQNHCMLQTYPRLGKLVGRFYDASGQPTAELASVQARAQEGKKLQVGGGPTGKRGIHVGKLHCTPGKCHEPALWHGT